MEQILNNLIYHIEYDKDKKIVYVRGNVKVRHLEQLRLWLISSGIEYNNIIIGKNYDGEY